MTKTSAVVNFFNHHLDDGHDIIKFMLNRYIHTSYMYEKQNIDKSWLRIQPGWPEYYVIGYRIYYDDFMRFAHKSGRIILFFSSGNETEIGLYKFKKFIRKHFNYLFEDD